MGSTLWKFAKLLSENQTFRAAYRIKIFIFRAVYLFTYPMIGGVFLFVYGGIIFSILVLEINLRIVVLVGIICFIGNFLFCISLILGTTRLVFTPLLREIAEKINISEDELKEMRIDDFAKRFREWNQQRWNFTPGFDC